MFEPEILRMQVAYQKVEIRFARGTEHHSRT